MPSNEQTPRVTYSEGKKDQKNSTSDNRVQPWKAFLGNVVNNRTALSESGPDDIVYRLKHGVQDNGVAS